MARKPGHRGERGISRKPLRRESRSASADLYARVRFLMHTFAHETAGAARTRLSLRPLFGKGEEKSSKPRAKWRREIARACLLFEIELEMRATISPTLPWRALMTPENIHLNSFMYEPIADMSDDQRNSIET